MNNKVTYHQQVSYCGKPRCKRCREGVGHGPYWYAYQTVDGRTTRKYIGKHLPPEAQAEMLGGLQDSTTLVSDRDQVIRIYTLGQFRLERRDPHDPLDWQTVTDSAWQHLRVRALLGCLISVNGRKLAREQIMDALWPDLDIETAGSRLDRAVYSLRQVFEPGRSKPATSPLLLTEREVLVLASHPRIWIDADVFEQLIAQAHEIKDDEDPGRKEQLLKEAAALYGGAFLTEDRRNDWTRTRRESLQRLWIGLLLDLADLMIKRNDLTGAIDPLDTLIALDGTNEAAVQRLMIILEQLGRRGEALRAYRKLAMKLQQEYNIVPLPETRTLYEDLRRGQHKGADTQQAANTGDAATRTVSSREGSSTGGTNNETPAIQIGRMHQSPLVGRQSELERLRGLVTATEHVSRYKVGAQRRAVVSTLDPHRRAQCVLLMGDVGIGKTRLAEELGRDVKKRGWAVAWSRVYSQEGTIPYRLWIEVMRKAMEQGVWQRQEVSRRPLVFQPLGALLPELYHNKILQPVEIPVILAPEQEQLRLWEAVRELLSLISESTPLMIVLDDLQWADSSSCELLAYLARRTYGYPIVIIGTCRENELEQNHTLRPLLTDLRRESAVETLSLERLSDENISSLVSHVTHASDTIVQKISTRAAGNPFFAEELARTIADNPSTSEVLNASEHDSLPDTITAVLTLRLNSLSAECRQLLRKAAVLGSAFEFQEISAMEANSPRYDEDTVLEQLEEALNSGMLTEEGTGTRITYQFWHPLLASHLYEDLSAARRANQHRRAADVLRTLYKDREEEYAARITHHLVRGGGDRQLIAQYAEIAGNRAYSLSSYPEAEGHYRVALEYLDESNENRLRLAYLLERLGECTRTQGGNEEALAFYERALEVRMKYGCDASSEDFIQEAELRAMLLCEMGMAWYGQGDMVQVYNYLGRAEQTLQEACIVDGPAWENIKYQQSYVYWREGNYNEARRLANEALDLVEKVLAQNKNHQLNKLYITRTRRSLAGDQVDLGRIHVLLGTIEGTGGRGSDGLPHLNKALEIFERYNSLREIAIVCCNMGDIYLRVAEYTRAYAVLRRSLNIAEHIGEIPLASFALGNMGILNLRTGNLIDAEQEMRQTILRVEEFHDPIAFSIWCAYLTTVLSEEGKFTEAKSSLTKALMIGRNKRVDPCIGLALVVLGNLRLSEAILINDCGVENNNVQKLKILSRAKSTLNHAMDMKGMEPETRIDGMISLAQILLLLGDITIAKKQIDKALGEAHQLELPWLIARGLRVAGNIFKALHQYDEATGYYEQSLEISNTHSMRLEYARTLQQYGNLLLEISEPQSKEYNDGIARLKKAGQEFEYCGANMDIKLLQAILEKYCVAIEGKPIAR